MPSHSCGAEPHRAEVVSAPRFFGWRECSRTGCRLRCRTSRGRADALGLATACGGTAEIGLDACVHLFKPTRRQVGRWYEPITDTPAVEARSSGVPPTPLFARGGSSTTPRASDSVRRRRTGDYPRVLTAPLRCRRGLLQNRNDRGRASYIEPSRRPLEMGTRAFTQGGLRCPPCFLSAGSGAFVMGWRLSPQVVCADDER